MQVAVDEIKKLLVPPQGSIGKNGRQGAPDEIKKKQLMELAIINGTYRTFELNILLRPSRLKPFIF